MFIADENREVNITEEEIKRQRLHYSGEQIYSNVSWFWSF